MAGCTHDGETITVVTPKDAEGRNVLLDTKVMYNDKGIEYEVGRLIFGTGPYGGDWDVECFIPSENIVYTRPLDSMYLEKPNSLKQLAEDLNRVQAKHEANGSPYRELACCYAERLARGSSCKECRLNHKDKTCFEAMMDGIVNRVNRLAGDVK